MSPEMIRFYLGEEAILENIQTYQCRRADECRYVLENLDELVVKEVHGSGGYGMLIGPKSTKAEISAYRKRIEADPAEFIAQPTLDLSTAPTLDEDGLCQRHVDFRPFCLVGKTIRLVPGGLTTRGTAGGFAGRQFEPGRRGQGHLGVAGIEIC